MTEAAQIELTPRQRQVLAAIADGMRNAEIADELGIAKRTVERYRLQLSERLGVVGTARFVKWAIKLGLTNPEPAKERRG